MRGLATLILATLLLLGLAVGAYVATDQFLAAAYTPSLLAMDPDLPPGESGPPLARRLVVIIADGLRADALSAMPFTDELWARSASAIVHLPSPTYAAAGWYTILTGATPELLGLPLLPDPARPGPRLPAGSLLALNVATGRTCAIALHTTWQSLFPEDWCSARLLVPGDDATADQQVADGARDMEHGRPDLMLIHFSHLDTIGQTYGATGPHYRQAAQALDGLIRQVVEPALANGAAIALISSHGLSDDGGTGGSDPSVTQVPFFLMGPGVNPGGYGVLDGTDVAPTLAALVGLPAPPLAQGRVRYDLLTGDAPWQTGRHLRTARQHLRLAEQYLATSSTGQGQDDHEGIAHTAEHIAQAEQAFQTGDVEAAWQAADSALQATDEAMRQGRAARLKRGGWPRLALVLAVLIPGGLLWLIWQRRRALLVAAGALAGLLATHLTFLTGGGHYSLSSVRSVEGFLLFALWQAGVGVMVMVIVVLGWRMWRRSRHAPLLARDLLGATWVMIGAWALPVALGYWQHSVGIFAQMPQATLAFWHLWGLVQSWSIPLFAVSAAWLAAGLSATIPSQTGC